MAARRHLQDRTPPWHLAGHRHTGGQLAGVHSASAPQPPTVPGKQVMNSQLACSRPTQHGAQAHLTQRSLTRSHALTTDCNSQQQQRMPPTLSTSLQPDLWPLCLTKMPAMHGLMWPLPPPDPRAPPTCGRPWTRRSWTRPCAPTTPASGSLRQRTRATRGEGLVGWASKVTPSNGCTPGRAGHLDCSPSGAPQTAQGTLDSALVATL